MVESWWVEGNMVESWWVEGEHGRKLVGTYFSQQWFTYVRTYMHKLYTRIKGVQICTYVHTYIYTVNKYSVKSSHFI